MAKFKLEMEVDDKKQPFEMPYQKRQVITAENKTEATQRANKIRREYNKTHKQLVMGRIFITKIK